MVSEKTVSIDITAEQMRVLLQVLVQGEGGEFSKDGKAAVEFAYLDEESDGVVWPEVKAYVKIRNMLLDAAKRMGVRT